MVIRVGPTEHQILKDITDNISNTLNSVGILNRVFSRIKSPASTERKIKEKQEEYTKSGKKIQDIFGIRVTLYFIDDEEIAIGLIKKNFIEVPESHSIDSLGSDVFGPQRCNLVFRIDSKLAAPSALFDHVLIDTTFEVQFRTILSEGWHEVEHDLRYKCKSDWDSEKNLSRQLNGQLATLETCSWAMLKVFEELAYKKYKSKQWPSFFRNILRIRFDDTTFSEPISNFLNNNNNIGKDLLKIERNVLLSPLSSISLKVPLKMDNVFFILNRAVLNNQQVKLLEPELLKGILDESFG